MATDKPMQLGMIGLGRMGANLVRRLMRDGHRCVVYDVNADAVKQLEEAGATGTSSLEEFASKLDRPRAAWLMLPAAIVDQTLAQLVPLFEAGDTIIDGGNSYYRDDITRAKQLSPDGIHYVDCGTSGGVWGLDRGYCLMIGGEDEAVDRLDPIFKSIAPGVGSAEPTPSRTRTGTAPDGYFHCGPNGAGHFVKMVHNGVEYGMMASIAEGLSIIKHANVGKTTQIADAENTPSTIPTPTSTTSTSARWPSCGVGVRSSDPGWWTSPPTPWPARRVWRSSRAGCRTQERADGPCSRRSTRGSRLR